MQGDPTCDECGAEFGDELMVYEDNEPASASRTVHVRCSREAQRYAHYLATGETDAFDVAPGWPRPTNSAGHPVPFVVPSPEELAHLDYPRNSLCALLGLCIVCGLEITSETCFVALDDHGGVSTDHALTHERCARMALARCPHLNGLLVSRWGTRPTLVEVTLRAALPVVRQAVNGHVAAPLDQGEIIRRLEPARRTMPA